jgi:ankyrin repeat protein
MKALRLLLLLLLLLPAPRCDARKSAKKKAAAKRQLRAARLGVPLAAWTQRPLGPPSRAGVAEVLALWAARPEAAASSATAEELDALRFALSQPWGAGATDSRWRSAADTWMARARQAAPTETVAFAMAASYLVDGISMGTRSSAALGECLQWYSVVVDVGEERQPLPMYEIALTRYASLLSQQIRAATETGGSTALRTQADTVYRTLINAGARMPREQVAQIQADYGFMLLEWSLTSGGGPPSTALGGATSSSVANDVPSLHRAASLLLQASPDLAGTQSAAFTSYGLALLWSFTGHWMAAAEALVTALTVSRTSHANRHETADGLDALHSDHHVCTLAAQLSTGLRALSASGNRSRSHERTRGLLNAAATDAGCTSQALGDKSAAALPRLLGGWTLQNLADPLLDAFATPQDPINPLYKLLYEGDAGAVRRTLRVDPSLARLPGPTGSTALSVIFYRIVEKQMSALGMYWMCENWDFEVESNLLGFVLEAGADMWTADNYGLTPAYLAIAGSGCTQCLEVFRQNGMLLDDAHLKKLFPGASSGVIFRLLIQMQTRQMVLASTILRTNSRASLRADIADNCKQLSTALDEPLLQKATVTFDELTAVETGWRSQWFKQLLLMHLDPNLTSQEHEGETLLHCSVKCGFIEIVEQLLDAGADVNAASAAGSTPLHVAATSGYNNIAKLLVERRANKNALDSSGRRPVDTVPLSMKELKTLLDEGDGDPAATGPETTEPEPSLWKPAAVVETKQSTPGQSEWSTVVASELLQAAQLTQERCDIDVLHSAENFTLTQFVEQYYQQKPLLVRAAAWDGDHRRRQRPFFTPESFGQFFGTHELKAGTYCTLACLAFSFAITSAAVASARVVCTITYRNAAVPRNVWGA